MSNFLFINMLAILIIIITGCSSALQKKETANNSLRTPASGREMGNAGDGLSSDFKQRAKNIYEAMATIGFNKFSEIDEMKFRSIIYDAFVSSDSNLKHNGFYVDALNFPKSSQIIVNRELFPALGEIEKNKIVLHEYLGLLELEIGNFNLTDKIFERFPDSSDLKNMHLISDCTANVGINFYAEEQYPKRPKLEVTKIARIEKPITNINITSSGFVSLTVDSISDEKYFFTYRNQEYPKAAKQAQAYIEKNPMEYLLYLEIGQFNKLNAIAFYSPKLSMRTSLIGDLIKQKQLSWKLFNPISNYAISNFTSEQTEDSHYSYNFDVELNCSVK